jgi:pyridoxamine 5'-phosphate oxidase
MADPETDPFARFASWMAEAEAREPNDPNAMALATATPDGRPSVRMVLLKGVDARGFTFFTNLESRKGQEARSNPFVALCFHWKSLRRQVRIEGPSEPVTDIEADAYFHSRARGSQIGAWASLQSQPLDARATLEQRMAAFEAQYPEEIPRPPHWSGLRVVPLRLEFWSDRPFRLHERHVYARPDASAPWMRETLYP